MWQSSSEGERSKRLRREMTSTETVFWNLVRDRRLDGLKFRRQTPVAGSVCDFVCLELKLVVELDGGIHRLREAEDGLRDAKLRSAGFAVLRSGNQTFLENPNAFLAAIRHHASNVRIEPPHPSRSAAHLLPRGEKDASPT
jgi:very-short-patch-repair endonuclease